MKKFILSLAVCLCAAFSAQAQWTVGARAGSGFQAQSSYHFGSENYVEGRLGMDWVGHGGYLAADFTALYMWNLCTMDWTPSAGQWFFDAGCGVGLGGDVNYLRVGVAGSARLGIKFNSAPVRLAVDWSPLIGPSFPYHAKAHFHQWGLCNLGISAVYCF